MSTYPYTNRNLFKESDDVDSIWKKIYYPKNATERGATGIFSIKNEHLTVDTINVLLDRYVHPVIQTEWIRPHTLESARDDFITVGYHRGFTIVVPPFSNSSKPVLSIMKFTLDEMPKLNYDIQNITTLGFCTSNLQESIEERCNWFIHYLKKIYLFLDAEFGWCDLFDHLAKFEGKDPRQYVFGMTFYGPNVVEEIGRDKLLCAPVYKVEELENGGILLMLGEQPFFPHPKRYRAAVGKHLGLSPPTEKKITVPAWMKSRKVGRIKLSRKRYFQLVVGVKAEEIIIDKTDTTLYQYFIKNIYEKKDMSSPEGAALAQWFNNLKTDLAAFVGGSRYEDVFEVVVGVPVSEPFNIDFMGRELDEEEMRAGVNRCSELFKNYGLNGAPQIHILGYDGSEEGL